MRIKVKRWLHLVFLLLKPLLKQELQHRTFSRKVQTADRTKMIKLNKEKTNVDKVMKDKPGRKDNNFKQAS